MKTIKLSTICMVISIVCLLGCRQVWDIPEDPPSDGSEKQLVTAITITGATKVGVGDSIHLNATVTPTTAESEVEWSSLDNSIATVNSTGTVTGVTVGPVDIIAKVTDESDISQTYRVSVVDEHTTVDKQNSLAIRAESFSLTLAEANAPLSEEVAKERAGVLVWALDIGATASITVINTELEGIQNAIVESTTPYDLTFIATHSEDATVTISKTVKVWVVDEDIVVGPDVTKPVLGLFAKGFALHEDKLATELANEAAAISKAQAEAWIIASATFIEPTVDTDELSAIQAVESSSGWYNLSFTATDPSDTSVYITKTVEVLIYNDHTATLGPDATNPTLGIYGKGFVVTPEEAASLTFDEILDYSEAFAWNIPEGANLTGGLAENDSSELTAINTAGVNLEEGPMDLHLKLEHNGESITHKIRVFIAGDNSSVGPDEDNPSLVLYAKSFEVESELARDLELLNSADSGGILWFSKALAWNVSDGVDITTDIVLADPAQLDVIRTFGEANEDQLGLPLTLQITDGEESVIREVLVNVVSQP